jgi:cell division protease FtsH
MVCEWGMSDDLGALTYGKKEEQIFLGREISQHRDFSEDTARKIDIAVKKFIDEAMETVTKLLEEHRDILALMAEELLEKETIVLSDIERMVEELRPGKYSSRMKKNTKMKKKVVPQPEESVEEQAEENSNTDAMEQPEAHAEAKDADSDVTGASDDTQKSEKSENP